MTKNKPDISTIHHLGGSQRVGIPIEGGRSVLARGWCIVSIARDNGTSRWSSGSTEITFYGAGSIALQLLSWGRPLGVAVEAGVVSGMWC